VKGLLAYSTTGPGAIIDNNTIHPNIHSSNVLELTMKCIIVGSGFMARVD
jgi:hypothetical protein